MVTNHVFEFLIVDRAHINVDVHGLTGNARGQNVSAMIVKATSDKDLRQILDAITTESGSVLKFAFWQHVLISTETNQKHNRSRPVMTPALPAISSIILPTVIRLGNPKERVSKAK